MKPRFGFLALTACLLAGCVYGPVPRYRARPSATPLSSEDIVRMVKAGVSDAVVIEQIKAVGLDARPMSEQIISLKKEGLSDAVIEAMVAARLPAPQRVEPVYDYPENYYYPYYYGPWWYGPYWYGWPYWGWHFNYYPGYHRFHPGYGPSLHRYRS
jgi:hypothetical protein